MRLITLITILAILLSSCDKDKEVQDILALVPQHDTSVVCGLQLGDAHRSSGTTWIDSCNIRYFISYEDIKSTDTKTVVSDYFTKSDKKYIQEKTKLAADNWAHHIGKVVFEVDSKEKANVIILFSLDKGEDYE